MNHNKDPRFIEQWKNKHGDPSEAYNNIYLLSKYGSIYQAAKYWFHLGLDAAKTQVTTTKDNEVEDVQIDK